MGGPEVEPALVALKYIFRRELKAHLLDIMQCAATLQPVSAATDYIETLARYFTVTKRVPEREIGQIMDEIFGRNSIVKIPLFEKWKREGFLESREEHWQEGRQEGLAEGLAGQQEFGKTIALSLLQRRFHPLDKRLENKIKTLPAEKLLQLSLSVLDFEKPQDVAEWLRINASQTKTRRKKVVTETAAE